MPDLPDAGGLLGCAGPLPDITVPEDAIEAAMEWDARDGCLLPDRHWFAGMLAAAMPALRRHDADKLASWEATAAELRRQLAGTNALLATAKAENAELRNGVGLPLGEPTWGQLREKVAAQAETIRVTGELADHYRTQRDAAGDHLEAARAELARLEAQRQAVLDLCDKTDRVHPASPFVVAIRAALGATGPTHDMQPKLGHTVYHSP